MKKEREYNIAPKGETSEGHTDSDLLKFEPLKLEDVA